MFDTTFRHWITLGLFLRQRDDWKYHWDPFFSLTNIHFWPSWNISIHILTLSENCSSVSLFSLRYFLASILETSHNALRIVPLSFW